MGHKTLIIDLDPQCNVSICGMNEEDLEKIWEEENEFIEDFGETVKKKQKGEYDNFIKSPRTIHLLLKPTEDGIGELEKLPPPVKLCNNLDLIPGRLTIHRYEDKVSERWNGVYAGDPLAIRTMTNIRTIAEEYAQQHNYEFIIIDTSPSLGALNKVIISTVDGFFIPALPDMFSMYGIKNIGSALQRWRKEFNTIYKLISEDKRKKFPTNFVRFLGYTIYNAKKYSKSDEMKWHLAQAHYNYAQKIPQTIKEFISEDVRRHLTEEQANTPIGKTAVMHSHNTYPNMAQKYKRPIWKIPSLTSLLDEDKGTISGNRKIYEDIRQGYYEFACDFLERIKTLDENL
jgi:cellulose biosynthesis protein BcsQ